MTRILGLDLGGTNVKLAVLRLPDGGDAYDVAVEDTASSPTHAHRGPSGVVSRLIEIARARLAAGIDDAEAVGLGLPGLFDPTTGCTELLPNLPGNWSGLSVREPISQALGLPVTLINDARAFVLAEGTLGAARGRRTVVGLTLGTGVGGGVMVDGELQLGAFGKAGEIGHQTVLPDGPRCGCGNLGCVEALTRADALAALGGRADPAAVYAAAAAGDERCRGAIETVAGYLGIGIANVYHVLGPDRVVIGGGIGGAGEALLEPLRTAVQQRATLVPAHGIDIVAAELGTFAGAIGAGLAAVQALVRAT